LPVSCQVLLAGPESRVITRCLWMTVTRWRMGFNWCDPFDCKGFVVEGEAPRGSGPSFFLALFLEQRNQVGARPLNMLAQELNGFLGVTFFAQPEQFTVIDFGFFFAGGQQ